MSYFRNWRQCKGKSPELVGSGVLRKCPICRKLSQVVMSSERFPETAAQKEFMVIQCIRECETRNCKYFEQSAPWRRECPYGNECLYRHVDNQGRRVHVYPMNTADCPFESMYEDFDSQISNDTPRPQRCTIL
jgi:hypothetical protein